MICGAISMNDPTSRFSWQKSTEEFQDTATMAPGLAAYSANGSNMAGGAARTAAKPIFKHVRRIYCCIVDHSRARMRTAILFPKAHPLKVQLEHTNDVRNMVQHGPNKGSVEPLRSRAARQLRYERAAQQMLSKA